MTTEQHGSKTGDDLARQERMAEFGVRFKIMRHSENRHGWSVSLVKYAKADDPLSLEQGFVLTSHESAADQEKYLGELAEMTGLEIEDGP